MLEIEAGIETILSSNQRQFLREVKVALSEVFDGRGISSANRKSEMNRLNKRVTLISRPCAKGGHTLYDSSNHCIQCRPQTLHHGSIHKRDAFVYIARSVTLGLLKIGQSKVLVERADGIRRDGYANATDWTMLYKRRFRQAGVVESGAHQKLKPFQVTVGYGRLGHGTQGDAVELFNCAYADARAAVESFSEEYALEAARESPLARTLLTEPAIVHPRAQSVP